MNKKYTVFISSTFEDLQEERKEVSQVLMEFNCIPVGMELFPASNEDQWSFIRKVISECDYYIVIIAGRYGSCSDSGLSYTEMEYRFALETGKPILAFLNKNLKAIPSGKVEEDPVNKGRLEEFRKMVQKKLCKYYSTPHELGSVVLRSINELINRYPSIGWVRGDIASDQEMALEILKVKNENEKLKERLISESKKEIVDTKELSNGMDKYRVAYSVLFKNEGEKSDKRESKEFHIDFTWDEIFNTLSFEIMKSQPGNDLRNFFSSRILDLEHKRLKEIAFFKNKKIDEIDVHYDSFQAILIQFMALKYIKKTGVRRHQFSEDIIYSLTEYGEAMMLKLKAIRKPER